LKAICALFFLARQKKWPSGIARQPLNVSKGTQEQQTQTDITTALEFAQPLKMAAWASIWS
jgi:hypothetical protein